jgi:hypothetical protein
LEEEGTVFVWAIEPTTYWKVLIEAVNVNLTCYGTISLRSPIRCRASVCVKSTVLAQFNVDKKGVYDSFYW